MASVELTALSPNRDFVAVVEFVAALRVVRIVIVLDRNKLVGIQREVVAPRILRGVQQPLSRVGPLLGNAPCTIAEPTGVDDVCI